MRPQLLLNQLRSYLERTRQDDSDGELLQRFVTAHDQNSFAKLLDRHGGMVMGVCRRIVGESHLAEDVYQATFLILSRKAASLRHTASLPAWLHRVAYRLALQTRRANRSRQPHEKPVERVAASTPLDELSAREFLTILDEELNRLPESQRTVLILCCLEGHSQEEAARALDCSTGAIKGRLERARAQLRERLTKRGLMLSSVLGMPLLLTSPGYVSAEVVQKTLALLGAGAAPTSGVAIIVEKFMLISFLTKFKVVGLSLLLVCGVGFAAGMMAQGDKVAPKDNAPQPSKVAKEQVAEAKVEPKKDLYGDPLPEGAVLRLGTLQRRAVGAQLAMSPDGKSVISVRGGKYVSIWEAETGKLRETRALLQYQSYALGHLSPDGRWLMPDGGISRRVLLVNVLTGKIDHEFKVKDSSSVSAMGLSPDGKMVAAICSVNETRMVKAWQIATGTELFSQTIPTVHTRHFVAFTPDGKKLLACFNSNETGFGLMCWEVSTNKFLWQVKNCTVLRPTFTRDGQFMLAWLDGDNNAVNLDLGQPVNLDWPPKMDWETRLRFLSDGKRLVMSTERGIVVWDHENHKEIRFLQGAGEEFVLAPDGKSIVTNNGSLQRWDLETGKTSYPDTFASGHIHEVTAIKFTADGKRLASASKDGSVRLWDAFTGKPIHTWPSHQASRPSDVTHRAEAGVQALDMSPDGQWIISAGIEEKLLVRNSTTQKSQSLDLPKLDSGESVRIVGRLHIASDGQKAFGGFGATLFHVVRLVGQPPHEHTDTLATWDLKTGKLLTATSIPLGGSKQSYLTERRQFFLRGDRVVDIPTAKEIAQLEERNGQPGWGPAVISPSGSLIMGTTEKVVDKNGMKFSDFGGMVIWEAATGKAITNLPLKRRVGEIGFHPNLRWAFTSGYDGITLWDLSTRKIVHRQRMPEEIRSSTIHGGFANESFASCVAFSPDGQRMATGHPDSTILIWELPTPITRSEPLDARTLASAWTDLEGVDAAKAWQQIWRLTQSPAQALPLLREKLKPIRPAPPSEVQPLIADLEHDEFARREQATKKLRELGHHAEAALRAAEQGKLSAEQKKRVEQLLAALADPATPLTSATLASLRAVRILELIGSPEAIRMLEELANGAKTARLTVEAKEAVERLSWIRPVERGK